jgi:hypothetical protein
MTTSGTMMKTTVTLVHNLFKDDVKDDVKDAIRTRLKSFGKKV